MPIETLISHLNEYLLLDKEEIEELEERAIVRKVKRRQYLLAAGEVCKHYNFVVEGCFKMYKVDEAAKEHNIMFAVENQWITDIGSFHAEQPSQLYIEAVEPAEVIQIKKPDLLYFYKNHLKFNRTFRVIIEDQFVELQNRQGRYHVGRWGFEKLEPDVMEQGRIHNRPALVAALHSLVEKHKLKSASVAMGVSGASAMVKRIHVPKCRQRDLEEYLMWEGAHYIPYDPEDVYLDFSLCSSVFTPAPRSEY